MNTSGSFLKQQNGFTLIELLVAITIGSILTTALMQTFSLQLATHRRHRGPVQPLDREEHQQRLADWQTKLAQVKSSLEGLGS